MGSKSEPYVSCIVIRGRPILPPVMTPFRSAEMQRYKELALAVETKNSGRRNRSSVATSRQASKRDLNILAPVAPAPTRRGDGEIQDHLKMPVCSYARKASENHSQSQSNANHRSMSEGAARSPIDTCGSPSRTWTRTSLSTPPSVASTDLDMYMSTRLESECPDSTVELDTSPIPTSVSDCSSTATITPQGPDLPRDRRRSPASSSEGEEDSAPHRGHCRRSSYTLEQPSPVLIAHFQKLAVESTIEGMEAKMQAMTEDKFSKYRHDPKDATVKENSDTSYPSVAELISGHCLSPRETYEHTYSGQVALSSKANNQPQKPTDLVSDKLLGEQESMFNELRETIQEKLVRMRQQWEEKVKQSCRELGNDAESLVEKPKSLWISETSAGLVIDGSSDDVENHQEDGEKDPGMPDADPTADGCCEWVSNQNKCWIRTKSPPKFGENDSGPTWLTQVNFTNDPQMCLKFQRLSAAVKGFLTRRLLRTEKVQTIIQTIKDTLEFALQLHSETPLKRGCVTSQDANLHQCLIAQLSGACVEFHDVFFKLTTSERMKIIAQDRSLKRQKSVKEELRERPAAENRRQHRRLSSATLKSIERKRHHGKQSPRGPYSYRGRSPRSRMSDRGYRRRMSEALDVARAISTSPRFVSDTSSTDRHSKASCSRSLSYTRQRVVKAKHKPQFKCETLRPHSSV